ncbi:MAG TPA: tetratricopeptide repeat protein, partial [Rubrobacter sp.]|nr:tetratricopeptide repeat protein [Rubrobacter sp.]
LEGIPLAIELAAARVGTLGTAQISERLEHSIGLLATSVHTAAPRQKTLRGALDWSHELLSADEKKLFGRLAVFAGGWTLEAAEAVGSGSDVLDLLSGLVDKSLVLTEAVLVDDVRYRFLEPVRQYAREKLEASGEAGEVHRRHAEYCLVLAEESERRLRGPDQAAWYRRLDADLDNLRTALGWLIEHGEIERGLKLGSALLFFWMWRGSILEGSRWLEEGLTRDGEVRGPVRAKALNALADVKLMLGEYERTSALLEESMSLYLAAGDEDGIAACRCDLGWLALFMGEHERATTLLEQSLVRFRESGDTLRAAFTLNRLAGVAGSNLDYGRSAALLQESISLYREVGDSKSMAMCLSMLGYLSLRQGDPDLAVEQIEEAMQRTSEAGMEVDGITHNVLALAVMARGEYERARGLIVTALTRVRRSGNRLHTVQGLETSAILATLQASPESAAKLWGAAEAEREVLGVPPDSDDQARFEPYLVAGSTSLGNEDWSTAWQEGRRLTLDEAVDHVLAHEVATPPAPERGRDPTSVLSRREREVAVLVSEGLSNQQIASQLYISGRTVEHHVASILRKLGLLSREHVASRLGYN